MKNIKQIIVHKIEIQLYITVYKIYTTVIYFIKYFFLSKIFLIIQVVYIYIYTTEFNFRNTVIAIYMCDCHLIANV